MALTKHGIKDQKWSHLEEDQTVERRKKREEEKKKRKRKRRRREDKKKAKPKSYGTLYRFVWNY